jgi:hypothetical protein
MPVPSQESTRHETALERLREIKKELQAGTKNESIASIEEASEIVWNAEFLYHRRLAQMNTEKVHLRLVFNLK